MRPIIVRCKKHLLPNIPNTCKKQEIRRWRGDTSFERLGTSRKKKIRVQRDVRNKSPSEKKDMHFVRNGKKKTFEENGKRDISIYIYLMKNGTSQEMYGISRETWWLTLRKLGNFNNI